jgi:hypothetical protein
MLDYKSTFGPAPHELGSLVMKLFVLVTVLLIISACFLADALRRLKKQFSLDKRLVVNQKTMCLHVTALFIHTFFIVVAQYITIYAFMNPAPINKNILNISRICLFGSQSISQAIVIYLFVQFSKPVSLTKDVESDDSDSDEYELDERRDPNIDMMYYVKQMPNVKMQRMKDVDYEIDKNKGALDYLFDETEHMDGSFVSAGRNFIDEDTKIDKFTTNLQKKWGE